MSESSVQYSRGYFRTQKFTKLICISSQQHTIPKKSHRNKTCQIQSEEKEQEGKQEESRAKVGQKDVNDREKPD